MTDHPHPGVRVKEELEKRGWNQQDLIYVLGCTPKAVNLIINGKQSITPPMSKALGEAFDLPPDHFADLQLSFDLSTADDPDPRVGLRARMMRAYPVREMVRRGWLPEEPKDFNSEIAKFFEADSLDSIPSIAHAAKKTNYACVEVPPPQLAWLYRVRQIANSISVPTYSESKFRTTLAQMRQWLIEPEEARHVPRALQESGVRFVVLEALPKSEIDGVCFWLSENEPVIGMSMQHDRIDNFWFVLRHECEHVLRGDGKDAEMGVVDLAVEGARATKDAALPEAERIANAASANFCVPAEKMDSFLRRKNPFYYEKDVIAFSKVNGIHPGLTVGQIQHATGRYDYLKRHQVKIRQHVLPNALVDGFRQNTALS